MTSAATLILVALASAYHLTVEPSPTVAIRWRDGVTDAQRASLERRFLLVKPTVHESRTFRYDLLDTSRSNLEAIVNQPEIEDTGDINRRTLVFPPDYPYGSSWTWIAHRIPVLRMPGAVPLLASVCVIVLILGVAGTVVRGRRPAAR